MKPPRGKLAEPSDVSRRGAYASVVGGSRNGRRRVRSPASLPSGVRRADAWPTPAGLRRHRRRRCLVASSSSGRPFYVRRGVDETRTRAAGCRGRPRASAGDSCRLSLGFFAAFGSRGARRRSFGSFASRSNVYGVIPVSARPVLKHGPRSPTPVRAAGFSLNPTAQ